MRRTLHEGRRLAVPVPVALPPPPPLDVRPEPLLVHELERRIPPAGLPAPAQWQPAQADAVIDRRA